MSADDIEKKKKRGAQESATIEQTARAAAAKYKAMISE